MLQARTEVATKCIKHYLASIQSAFSVGIIPFSDDGSSLYSTVPSEWARFGKESGEIELAKLLARPQYAAAVRDPTRVGPKYLQPLLEQGYKVPETPYVRSCFSFKSQQPPTGNSSATDSITTAMAARHARFKEDAQTISEGQDAVRGQSVNQPHQTRNETPQGQSANQPHLSRVQLMTTSALKPVFTSVLNQAPESLSTIRPNRSVQQMPGIGQIPRTNPGGPPVMLPPTTNNDTRLRPLPLSREAIPPNSAWTSYQYTYAPQHNTNNNRMATGTPGGTPDGDPSDEGGNDDNNRSGLPRGNSGTGGPQGGNWHPASNNNPPPNPPGDPYDQGGRNSG
ncbi:hypothetical protein VKT23_009086 [Stygiomarasmius scandens]|uniref:Uncharacterized protein n=1 Tax=Marasmiellus scandens TaxID=2682957 RepID=A0ABR1JIY7_9AGAR